MLPVYGYMYNLVLRFLSKQNSQE